MRSNKFQSFFRARFSCLITLFAALLPIVARAATSNDEFICREGFLQVVSPDGVTVEEGRAAAKQVMAAWKFDLSVMHWAHPAGMNRALTLRLISDARMKREAGSARAYAEKNGDRFDVRMGLIGDGSIDVTFAHELGHIQAFRVLGGFTPKIPNYFYEGHGLVMN
jgi:hypothetical protein